MADLKQFLELFRPLPGNHYLQVTTHIDETTYALYDLVKSVDGELEVALYSQDDLDYTLHPEIKIQHIKNFKQSFRALPRNNDSVIFKDILHLHENQQMILKTAYTTLANTADIIIMQKRDTMDKEAMYALLEAFEFRAPNVIDVLIGYDLIMAKKMHMWGNGL